METNQIIAAIQKLNDRLLASEATIQSDHTYYYRTLNDNILTEGTPEYYAILGAYLATARLMDRTLPLSIKHCPSPEDLTAALAQHFGKQP